MLDSNTNKVTWVGVAVGVVALLGIGASQLYPDAFDNAKSQIVKVTTGFSDGPVAGTKSRLASVPNITDDFENSKFNYRYFDDTNKTVEINGPKDLGNVDKNLIIPAAVVKNGVTYAVTSVDGFNNYDVHPIELDSVSIPSSVKTIQYGAFANSTKAVVLSEGLETIKGSAFYNRLGVDGYGGIATEVVIPNSVKTIGNSAFYGNYITALDLGTGVTKIEPYTFAYHNLSELTMPKQIKDIGDYAFEAKVGMGGLKSVKLNDGLETIGKNSFIYNRLQEVQIPKTVKTVGDEAFIRQRSSDSEGYKNTLKRVVVGNDTIFADNSFELIPGGQIIRN